MVVISWPDNTTDVIDAIRGAIGREVVFNREVREDCPACGVDPVTGNSTNPFCLTCSGIGYLITYSGTSISGHVTWRPSEVLNWRTGGQWPQYDCQVQIKNTPENVYVVDNCKYVVVDGKELRIEDKTYRGVKELNRIILGLKER